LNRHVLRTLDPKIEPPPKPDDASEVPKDRSFGPPPLLRPDQPKKVLVVFAHGKESGPWGIKIRHLAHIAKRHGATVLSPDYSDLADPDQRVARLLALTLPAHDELILVGSSMGGYVSTVASQTLKPRGLFLMAPAVGMPGYAVQNLLSGETEACIVHGWQDEVIPVGNAIEFAKATQAELHLIKADHRLATVLPTVGQLFEDFLFRIISA
jgi:predicted esterase